MDDITAGKFEISDDGVDPNEVPKRILHTGAEIPAIGLGTFGSDRFSGDEIASAVLDAASVGYRHFDCASVYGNEEQIGHSFRRILEGGIPREELWVTSKLWNDMHGQGDVLRSCRRSLNDLQVEYLDLFLIHWPFPNFHAPGCDVDSRSPDAKPYIHDDFMKTWRQMEDLVKAGLVRHIGTSNMTVPKLEKVIHDAEIIPACNEMELHPHFQQQDLFDFVKLNGIQPIGFCPIGSPTRPDRDKTLSDTVDIDDLVILAAAERLKVHPAVICVKWAVQRGQIPIPFSVFRNEYLGNIQSTISDPLTDEEMEAIAGICRNCRLIKGQVFLWKDGQGWEDLWDLDGNITPP